MYRSNYSLTRISSRLSFNLTAQVNSCWCATLSTPSLPPPPFSLSFSNLPLKVELRSRPFLFVFDFCPFFPAPPSTSEPGRRPSRSSIPVVPPSPSFDWWMVLCLVLGLRWPLTVPAARGCLGELPGSRVVMELVTNMERTLFADSRVLRALWIRLNLCDVFGHRKNNNTVKHTTYSRVYKTLLVYLCQMYIQLSF